MYCNLRAELARAGLTNGKIAEILQISTKTISNKCNGRSDFTLSEMERLRDALPNGSELALEYLFQRSEAPVKLAAQR
jgi:plasmid maintenance system antidote protein VapI